MAAKEVIVRVACVVLAMGLASVATAGACRSAGSAGGGIVARTPPAPPGSAAIPAASGVTAERPPWEVGAPSIAVVLDDPRLAAAHQSDADGDDRAAADEVQRVRSTISLDPKRACEWSYLAGRLYLAAGDASAAAAAFENATVDGGSGCPLGPYARLREAEALVHGGRGQDAFEALRGVGDEIAAREETQLARADALVLEGDRSAAVAIWRALLASAPRGLRWVDSSLQLARALLDGQDGPPAGNAREAFDRVTRVIVEAPLVADKLDAPALRERAALAMGLRASPRLTVEERTREAQAWLDASQPRHARELADAVLREVASADREHMAIGCRAATVRAQATPRGRAEDAAEAWGVAISRCREGTDADARAVALYQGGKASGQARRYGEALSRFAAVEHQFPTHRLADDARYHSALLIDDQGDRARSLALLASIADAYPDGDMGKDALFRVALAKIEAQELPEAQAILDRLLASPPDAWSWGSVTRAEYFRARVAQLAGEQDDAKTRYAALVAHRPLSYPMLLAFSRLKDMDEAFALSTLQDSVRSEPGGPFVTGRHAELESGVFERFLQLLEVGEIDAARREAAATGLMSEATDSEVLWVVGWLFERAGAPEIGHSFARTRLTDYRSHWPSGRWRFAWEVAFPRPWAGLVARESDSSGIPAPLTWAIMREESAFDPEARSPANAIGLMQLMGSTAQKVAQGTPLGWDEQALRRPQVSIALGTRLLSSLRTSFPGHPELAIAAYNGGAVAVRRWLSERGADDADVFIERIPYDETRNYVKRVLASQASYAYLYAPASLDELTAMVHSADSRAAAATSAPAHGPMSSPISAVPAPATPAAVAAPAAPSGVATAAASSAASTGRSVAAMSTLAAPATAAPSVATATSARSGPAGASTPTAGAQ